LFDGSNYRMWSDTTRAWLQTKGLWQITSGQIVRPAQMFDEADAPTFAARLQTWRNLDDEAFDAIMLSLNLMIRSETSSLAMSQDLWEFLKLKYATSEPSSICRDLMSISTARFQAAQLVPSVAQMAEKFQRLTAQNILVPDMLQATLLLAALPRKYEHLA
jgi:hypothetical protein